MGRTSAVTRRLRRRGFRRVPDDRRANHGRGPNELVRRMDRNRRPSRCNRSGKRGQWSRRQRTRSVPPSLELLSNGLPVPLRSTDGRTSRRSVREGNGRVSKRRGAVRPARRTRRNPYDGTTLPGYFYRVDDSTESRPTLIATNGYDSTIQELTSPTPSRPFEGGTTVSPSMAPDRERRSSRRDSP